MTVEDAVIVVHVVAVVDAVELSPEASVVSAFWFTEGVSDIPVTSTCFVGIASDVPVIFA